MKNSCQTVSYSIRTQRKVFLVYDKRTTMQNSCVTKKSSHSCYDIRGPNLLKLKQQLQSYKWNSLLVETYVSRLHADLIENFRWFVKVVYL
jgi:hypothetical protein